jgi:hypothetical protein
MLSIDDVFRLLPCSDRDLLVDPFLPLLPSWAHGILKYTFQATNYSFEEELVLVGQIVLIETLQKRLDDGDTYADSTEFFKSIQRPVNRAMRQELKYLRPPRGFKKVHIKDPDIFNWDDSLSRRTKKEYNENQEFFRQFASEAIALAMPRGWDFVEMMVTERLTVAAVAAREGLAPTTVRSRLKRLRKEIVCCASPELAEVGEEILGQSWNLAV